MSAPTTTPASRKRKGSLAGRRLYKRARASPMTVVVGRGPVAQKTVVTLKYCCVFASDGTSFDKRFNLNSIYSPEYSGGTQPLGRDQYATFYNRYRVLKVHMRLLANASSGSQKVVIIPDNTAGTYGDMSLALMQRDASQHAFPACPGGIIINRTFYPHKVTGVTKADYSDDRFQALMSATPAEGIYLHVCQGNVDNAGTSSGTVSYSIELRYTVELFDPNPLAGS